MPASPLRATTIAAAAAAAAVLLGGAASAQAKPAPAKSRSCVVPPVVTRSATFAKRALTAAGCRVRVLRGPVRSGLPAVVVRQSAGPGRTRPKGTVVTVRVASPTHCQLRDKAKIVLRTPDVVVTEQITPLPNPTGDVYGQGSVNEWWTCLTARPNVRPLLRTSTLLFGGVDSLRDFHAAGSKLVFLHLAGDQRHAEDFDTVEAIDLAAGGTPHPIAVGAPAPGGRITGLSTDGQTISWADAGAPQSAPWPAG